MVCGVVPDEPYRSVEGQYLPWVRLVSGYSVDRDQEGSFRLGHADAVDGLHDVMGDCRVVDRGERVEKGQGELAERGEVVTWR
jgi:hypothetical protein